MSWARLQSASGNNSGSTTVQAAFGSNVSSGSTLIAAVCGRNFGGNTSSVKDGAGNSFVAIANTVLDGNFGNEDLSLWALNTPAGDVGTKPAITATGGGSGFQNISVLIQEVSGIVSSATAAGFTDGSARTTSGSSTGPAGPPAYASTSTNEYLVYVYGGSGNNGYTGTPSGYTADTNGVTGSNNCAVEIAYRNSAGGTESGQYTDGSGAWGEILVALKLAPAQLVQPMEVWRTGTPTTQWAVGLAETAWRTGAPAC